MYKQLVLVLLIVISFGTLASEDSLWSSDFEVGAVVSTGNTEEKNLRARVDSVRDGPDTKLKHALHLNLVNNSANDEKTAKNLYSSYQVDYKLENDHALYARIAYEDDRFSGFDYQTDLTLGYKRQIVKTEIHDLSFTSGFGYRYSELINGESVDEAIIRLAGSYSWQISEFALFQQLLSAEIGNESTISRSETSLKTAISGNLAMKVSLLIKHQSEVPADRDKTDTETSLSLVYQF